jgi:hypothetical protein
MFELNTLLNAAPYVTGIIEMYNLPFRGSEANEDFNSGRLAILYCVTIWLLVIK